jgi:hypothetical protein
MQYLSIDLPGGRTINAPSSIPRGGLPTLVKALKIGITILIVFGTIYALITFVWGAILWITSSGDKAKIEKARSKIIFSLIGLALVFGAAGIMALISTLVGIPLLEIGL